MINTSNHWRLILACDWILAPLEVFFSLVLDTPVKDDKQVMKELAKKFDAPTIRSVAKLGDQGGQPSAKTLSRALLLRTCWKSWVACANIHTPANGVPHGIKPDFVRIAPFPSACSFSHPVVDEDIYVVENGKAKT